MGGLVIRGKVRLLRPVMGGLVRGGRVRQSRLSRQIMGELVMGGMVRLLTLVMGGLVMRWQMIAHYVRKMSKRDPVTRFG